jgi:WD40 repeat protein
MTGLCGWNGRTANPRRPHPPPGRGEVHLFQSDGQRLLSADLQNDRAQIRDVASGRVLAETPAREGYVMHADFSPDGQRVVTASEDGMARV